LNNYCFNLYIPLLVFSLIRYCNLPNVIPGDIFTTFNDVVTFTASLDSVPFLVQQISRLVYIGQRVQQPYSALDLEQNGDTGIQ
jgi:hypothetical protein